MCCLFKILFFIIQKVWLKRVASQVKLAEVSQILNTNEPFEPLLTGTITIEMYFGNMF